MQNSGSLINHLYSRMTKGQPIPEKGMGATILLYSDRHGATIQEVFTKGKYLYVAVTRDEAKRTDDNGMSDCQDYTYSERPDAPRSYFRFNGESWEQVRLNSETGRYKKISYGNGLRIGERQEYHDFSF